METSVLGRKIAEARKKSNLSQAQLAKELFISPQAVGKWERGESFPDLLTFDRMAVLLGVDLNYFSANFDSIEVNPSGENKIDSEVITPSKRKSWNLSSENLIDTDFSGLKNLSNQFSSSNIQNCKFVGSDLTGLTLKGNNIDQCDFTGSDFTESQFQRSNLQANTFVDCSFVDAGMSGSYAMGNDFSKANLTDFTFKNGGFQKNNLQQTILERTSFIGSQIIETVFEGDLKDCHFERCSFKRVTFQNARIYNTFFKHNSHLKKIEFVNCQVDAITFAFLKTGKANLEGIILM